MKTLTLLLTFFSCTICSTPGIAQGWQKVTNSGVKIGFSVFIFDKQVIIHDFPNSRLAVTSDHGESWSYRTATNFRQVYFINAQTGWAISDRSPAVCWKTSDGGNTWTQGYTFPTYLSLLENDNLQFVDANTGFIGWDTDFYITTDGGMTFTRLTDPARHIYAIDFVDATRGWAIGTLGKIWATTNGGNDWTTQDNNCYKSFQSRYQSISMLDNMNGYAGGIRTDGKLSKTTDGGASWECLSTPFSSAVTWERIRFADAEHLWLMSKDTLIPILFSSNGGGTWDQITLPDLEIGLNDLNMQNSDTGWAIAHSGSLYRFPAIVSAVETLPDVEHIVLSPNPTSGTLSINGMPENVQTISVVNILGQSMMELTDVHSPVVALDLSQLVQGTYYVRFVMPNAVVTKLVIRE